MKTDLQVVIDTAEISNNFNEFVSHLRHLSNERDEKQAKIDIDFDNREGTW